MSVAEAAAVPLSDADHRAQLRRAVIASTVGTIIEWYDFLLYGQMAALVFAKLYFPSSDPLTGTLQAFAVFAVGFGARPIGAAIFGHFGDRIGRKAALIATLLLTGLSTFLVGCVPDLRADRHLGASSVGRVALHSGDRRRRRVGWLGLALDGMGAHEQKPRPHRGVAAIWRTCRVLSREPCDPGV